MDYIDTIDDFCESNTKEKSFLNYIKASSFETYIHSINVAHYAKKLVKTMYPYEPYIVKETIKGALLHDIGKCHIPNEILRKKGKLNTLEMEVVRRHIEIGESLLQGKVSHIVLDICKMHHEKLDGSGYIGIKKDIPTYVQIVTVADMYEALRSERSYKDAYDQVKSMEILHKEVKEGKLNKVIVDLLYF